MSSGRGQNRNENFRWDTADPAYAWFRNQRTPSPPPSTNVLAGALNSLPDPTQEQLRSALFGMPSERRVLPRGMRNNDISSWWDKYNWSMKKVQDRGEMGVQPMVKKHRSTAVFRRNLSDKWKEQGVHENHTLEKGKVHTRLSIARLAARNSSIECVPAYMKGGNPCPKVGSVRRLLEKLVALRVLRKSGKGVKKDPFMYTKIKDVDADIMRKLGIKDVENGNNAPLRRRRRRARIYNNNNNNNNNLRDARRTATPTPNQNNYFLGELRPLDVSPSPEPPNDVPPPVPQNINRRISNYIRRRGGELRPLVGSPSPEPTSRNNINDRRRMASFPVPNSYNNFLTDIVPRGPLARNDNVIPRNASLPPPPPRNSLVSNSNQARQNRAPQNAIYTAEGLRMKKIKELKRILETLKLPTSGKKEDLVARIYDHQENKKKKKKNKNQRQRTEEQKKTELLNMARRISSKKRRRG